MRVIIHPPLIISDVRGAFPAGTSSTPILADAVLHFTIFLNSQFILDMIEISLGSGIPFID